MTIAILPSLLMSLKSKKNNWICSIVNNLLNFLQNTKWINTPANESVLRDYEVLVMVCGLRFEKHNIYSQVNPIILNHFKTAIFAYFGYVSIPSSPQHTCYWGFCSGTFRFPPVWPAEARGQTHAVGTISSEWMKWTIREGETMKCGRNCRLKWVEWSLDVWGLRG